MTYSIAIPSSNRALTVREKTLATLLAGGVDPGTVTLWVPDADQAAAYAETTSDLGVDIRWGHGIGMREARNAIAAGYPPGTRLLQIDDDITTIQRAVDRQTLQPLTDLPAFFDHAFDVSQGHLWCVYPVPNAFFMRPGRVRRGGLWYAEGALFGYVVTGSRAREVVVLDDKEDFERSCRFYTWDGEVVRFDDVTYRTKFYKEAGGMQDYRTADTVREGAQRLQRMYPHLATAYLAKSGHWEVKLKDRTRQAAR